MLRRDLARVVFAVAVGTGVAVVAPLGAAGNGHGNGCAVGNQSVPALDHSHPCPTPPGCAIGNARFVGDRSKPCPAPGPGR